MYAVNCGGEAHTDMLGVKYERDDNRHGTPSDYGKQLMIGRVSQQDQILYQVETNSCFRFCISRYLFRRSDITPRHSDMTCLCTGTGNICSS